ncbi:GntR family transcriptional regulator [Conyzicola nivalis]|uniref:GntR family transcriptional regulator n=2 Tax=Conyzicola nivalis TaxID=1477021 RepID=A0A916SIF0_9MICO|nr:GntR family transcriptional regulator [Conyzicola nivalis]
MGRMPTPTRQGVHKRQLLRDDVYESLRNAIVDGTFAPGERLKDPQLEDWLGVSRTPIREALLRLERAGLVITQPGRATTVAPFDLASTISAQQVAAAMHELAAQLAVPVITPEQIDAMVAANSAFALALDVVDADAALDADHAFHEVFVAASGNQLVADVLEQTTPLLHRVERMRFASFAGRASVAQHDAVIERTRAGDATGAAALVRENWLSLRYTGLE